MTKKNFWNDPEKGSIFLCLSMVVGLGLPCLCSLLSVCPVSLPRRLPPRESPRTSTSMPGPFRAIREAAASRRRALGAVSGTSANGGGIDALRWVVVVPLSLSGSLPPVTLLKCLPGAAPHRAAARAHCFQLTLKKLQFLYFIGMSSFLVKATSVE